ncbi:MAG: HD domain-containing protein [Planctomycetes bacterium]|nr:HD domain-containing protein [Planctomycetota bacterium]
MSNLDAAIRLAAEAHAGQKDKSGLPYITHPLRVMGRVEGEAAQIVAVLHDVVEDTDLTLDDLRRAGFSEEIVAAVDCVTHAKEQPYADYVIRCKGNPLARVVKLADLEDNSQLHRALLRPDRVESDLRRLHRYLLSYKHLTDGLSEEQYQTYMANFG